MYHGEETTARKRDFLSLHFFPEAPRKAFQSIISLRNRRMSDGQSQAARDVRGLWRRQPANNGDQPPVSPARGQSSPRLDFFHTQNNTSQVCLRLKARVDQLNWSDWKNTTEGVQQEITVRRGEWKRSDLITVSCSANAHALCSPRAVIRGQRLTAELITHFRRHQQNQPS